MWIGQVLRRAEKLPSWEDLTVPAGSRAQSLEEQRLHLATFAAMPGFTTGRLSDEEMREIYGPTWQPS